MIASSSAVDVSLQAIVSELHGRKAGKGYILRCPAHDDHRPSLSLAVRDGKLLVKCHAGCSQKALIVKLRSLGLWPVSGDHREPARLGALIDTYDYTDEGGKLSCIKCAGLNPKTSRYGWTGRGRGGLDLGLWQRATSALSLARIARSAHSVRRRG